MTVSPRSTIALLALAATPLILALRGSEPPPPPQGAYADTPAWSNIGLSGLEGGSAQRSITSVSMAGTCVGGYFYDAFLSVDSRPLHSINHDSSEATRFPVPVPEPTTLSLLGLGLAGAMARRRMNRR